MGVIGIAAVKAQLKRIDGHLKAPVILIGGLAVKHYNPARNSEDIDLVCSHDVSSAIVKALYPTNEWNLVEQNDDDYRPDYFIEHKFKKDVTPPIRFGPKILERGGYKFLNWSRFEDGAVPYHVLKESLRNILVPNIEILCFSKVVSFIGRSADKTHKIDQDLQDLVDLSNHDGFRLGIFHNLIREADAESYIREGLRERLAPRTALFSAENSHLRWIAELFGPQWAAVTLPPPAVPSEPTSPAVEARSSVPDEARPDNGIRHETQSLLRISTLRGINDYVERFHVFSNSCQSLQELEEAHRDYHEWILLALRMRGGEGDVLEADVLEYNEETGELLMHQSPTSLNRRQWLPEMKIRLNEAGEPQPPQPGDGVATYTQYANMTGDLGVAVVNDTSESGDIEYFRENRPALRETIGWYQPTRVSGMFKRSRVTDPPPYRSLLSAAILQTLRAGKSPSLDAEVKCIGVLNLTSDARRAFSEEDCAWAQACASLIASFTQSYITARRALQGAATAAGDVPAKLGP
ncbi:MAG: hypothetical protein EPO40_01720 [Myxococcaceae bacterium]|nr:MAG: hypothetical protein EPO40_01720 [Myxococcaceae bacterium]